jgi:glutamyl-tRNA reductase
VVKPHDPSANNKVGSSPEVIRRHEVYRALKRMDLSCEEEEVVERMSRSLVDGLLRGPISEAMRRAGARQRLTAPHRGS